MSTIGEDLWLIAELSGNHLGSLDRAKTLIKQAFLSGATHVKIQTYTPDTITLNVDKPEFRVTEGHNLWGGRTLYDLYREVFTPWEWHAELFEYAREVGVILFSTPFDPTAVELLESLDTPLYKIASLETGDLQLIELVAMTGKPLIVSTGATTLSEIDELVAVIEKTGNRKLTLLLCTSAYPTPVEGVHLRKLDLLRKRYGYSVGLSDHTIDLEASLGAIALGANIIERHFTLSRNDGGPDSSFSLEPHEFRKLRDSATKMLSALGEGEWSENTLEDEARRFRRSLYICRDVKSGEKVSNLNVRSIRPSNGLEPKHLINVIGKTFVQDYVMGTPLGWELLRD